MMQRNKLQKLSTTIPDQESLKKVNMPFAAPKVTIPNKSFTSAKGSDSVLESCSTISCSTQRLRQLEPISKERAKNDQKILSSLQASQFDENTPVEEPETPCPFRKGSGLNPLKRLFLEKSES